MIEWTESLDTFTQQKAQYHLRKAQKHTLKARCIKTLHHLLSISIIFLSLAATVLNQYKESNNQFIQISIFAIPPILSCFSSIIAYFSFSHKLQRELDKVSEHKQKYNDYLIISSQPLENRIVFKQPILY